MQYREPDPFVLKTFNHHLKGAKDDAARQKLKGKEETEFIIGQLLASLAATEYVIDALVEADEAFGNADRMLDLVDEFESLTMSLVGLDEYQWEYFIGVHIPETSTDLWTNVYVAEREKDPNVEYVTEAEYESRIAKKKTKK